MSTSATDLLSAFEKLCPKDQRKVAAEIFRVWSADGEFTGEAYRELGTAVLLAYDKEEGDAPAMSAAAKLDS